MEATSADAAPDSGIWSRLGPYRMTWSDFGILVERLAQRIRGDGFRPDAICCVARGGLVAAGYLAARLEVDRLHFVRVRRTVDDAVYAAKQAAQLRILTPDGLRGAMNVLIVDDIVGTGVTAHLVERHVREHVGGDVRLAALTCNGRSTYRPHYRAAEVDDWVVFPWEADATTPDVGRALELGSTP